MLYHNCKNHGEVYLDMRDKVLLLARHFAIRPDGIKPSNAIVYNVENLVKPEFYCISCGNKIEAEEILVKCQMCGENFALEKIYKVSEVGGFYCKEHCEEYFPGKRKWNLSSIFSKFAE